MVNRLSMAVCMAAWIVVFFLCATTTWAEGDALSHFDVRKNYSGNPKATAFSDTFSDNGVVSRSGQDVHASVDTSADVADSLSRSQTFSDNDEMSLEQKREMLRSRTLANYATVSKDARAKTAITEASETLPLPTVTKEQAVKHVEKQVEKQIGKQAEKQTDTPTPPAVESKVVPTAPAVVVPVSSVPVPPKKEEVKIIKTDIKNAVSNEADDLRRAVPDGKTVDEKTAQATTKVIPSDPSCANAELEADRARSATTQADKLFYLRRASRLCPGFAGYHVEIGQVFSALCRLEDARFSYNKALEIDPGNAEAKKLIGGLNGKKSECDSRRPML